MTCVRNRKPFADVFVADLQRGPEETLDPSDWAELRGLGHRMLDDMMDYLSSVRERAVWRPVPPEIKQKLSALRTPL